MPHLHPTLKSPIQIALLLTTALGLSSCASDLKHQACQKTNWYEHGRKMALRDQHPESDALVQSCKKVEAPIDHSAMNLGFKVHRAQKCRPKAVNALGRTGKVFRPKLCAGYDIAQLTSQYQKGLRHYCQPQNGYRIAATGQPYTEICPSHMRRAFRKEFHLGRQVHLSNLVRIHQAEISQIDRKIKNYHSQLHNQRRALQRLPPPSLAKGSTSDKNHRRQSSRQKRHQDAIQRLQHHMEQARQLKRKKYRAITQAQREISSLYEEH